LLLAISEEIAKDCAAEVFSESELVVAVLFAEAVPGCQALLIVLVYGLVMSVLNQRLADVGDGVGIRPRNLKYVWFFVHSLLKRDAI
jgi:hypothetical protein